MAKSFCVEGIGLNFDVAAKSQSAPGLDVDEMTLMVIEL